MMHALFYDQMHKLVLEWTGQESTFKQMGIISSQFLNTKEHFDLFIYLFFFLFFLNTTSLLTHLVV